jgi:hypothetical protein
MDEHPNETPALCAPISICGRRFGAEEIALVRDLGDRYPGISRNELALTVCELIDWHRPSGRAKSRECLDLFDHLEQAGVCRFPTKKRTRPPGSPSRAPAVSDPFDRSEISGELSALLPLALDRVCGSDGHRHWRDLMDRFHYLGYRTAFGASIRYLIFGRAGQELGCLQYSSPAWRMKARDEWIGWSDGMRRLNLQRIVNQSRFLVLPWVHVPNLASHVLAKSVAQLPEHWSNEFGVTPLMVETLVDVRRFSGTCYRAANWIAVGHTSGRGRMDREHRRHGAEVKSLFLYPLSTDARVRLRQGDPASGVVTHGAGLKSPCGKGRSAEPPALAPAGK